MPEQGPDARDPAEGKRLLRTAGRRTGSRTDITGGGWLSARKILDFPETAGVQADPLACSLLAGQVAPFTFAH